MTPIPAPAHWDQLATRLAPHQRQVSAGVPLSRLTTFRIGGPAGLLCPVENVEQARRFLDFAADHGLPWTCLGGGSNILADDAGFAGLVLRIQTRDLAIRGDAVRVGAGWNFDDLIATTLDEGLTGLEFASGIPGTLGGALVGNAGCYGQEVGGLLVEATVLRPDGRVVVLGPGEFAFAYRTSALKGRADVVLDMVLQLARGDRAAAAALRAEHLADRARKHPSWDDACAGSYFQNLPPRAPGERRRAAGVLLEEVGAKQMREGAARVYPKHANIIVNAGGATSAEVLRLAARMKAAVRERFGETLEEEVRHLVTPRASSDPDAA